MKQIESETLKKVVKLSLLYDFYGELLKKHQKEIFEDYILNDLSLSEIADEQGISRQGVYDIIKRCSKQLMEYEQKLGLVQKFYEIKESLQIICKLTSKLREKGDISLTDEIDRITVQILEQL